MDAGEETLTDLRARVTALFDAYHAGLTDDQRRRECDRELGELREIYRRNSRAFPPDLVDMLKQVEASLRRPPPDIQRVLAHDFAFTEFRLGQKAIIAAVVAGRDCAGLMPTGAGTSVTYQLLAR